MSKVTNKNLPAYLEKMEAEVLELNYKSQSLKMSFNPDEFFAIQMEQFYREDLSLLC